MPEQTLAQMVRAKYPGAYDDLNDQQLEAAVLKKFPGTYDDLPRTTTQTPPQAQAQVGPTRPMEGTASALLPTAMATGASMAVGKMPVLSTIAAGVGGAMGEGFRRTGRLLTDPIPEGAGLDAVKRLGGEALEIPGAMLKQGAIQAGAEAAGGVVMKGAKALGTAVYRGYLKPSLANVNIKKAREIVQTGIREMLPITKAGEDRAKRLIGDLNNQVNAMLATAKGGRVDLRQVAQKVRDFAQRKYNRPGVPDEDLQAALRVADNIDNHPSLVGASGTKTVAVNPADANKVKQGLDTAVGDTAFGVERGAATEARKTGRRAVREKIEAVAPNVKPLNARESKLIDAMDAIRHAAGREENRSALFGVPTLVAGAAAGTSYGANQDSTTALLTALVARGALTPAVASRAAMLTAKYARLPGIGTAMAVRMGALAAMRESGSESEQLPK